MNSGQLVRADATEARPLPDLWTKLGLASPMGQTTANGPEELPDMESFSVALLAADLTETGRPSSSCPASGPSSWRQPSDVS